MKIPKVRGVFISLVIACMVWVVSMHLLSFALYVTVVMFLWVWFLDGLPKNVIYADIYLALIGLRIKFLDKFSQYSFFFPKAGYVTQNTVRHNIGNFRVEPVSRHRLTVTPLQESSVHQDDKTPVRL